MSAFATTDIIDAAILLRAGLPFRLRELDGSFLSFVFDECSEADARAILSTPEASTCRSYHRSLVKVRKAMSALRGRVGQ